MRVNPKPDEPLLNRAAPFNDESIRCFVGRLSKLNYYKSQGWITNWFRSYTTGAKKLYLEAANPKQIELLARLSLMAKDKIYNITLNKYGDKLYKEGEYYADDKGRFFIFPQNLKKITHISGAKYCPRCLRENLYHKNYWDLYFVTTCLNHNAILIDRCSYCKGKISVTEIIEGTHKCGNDLTKELAFAADQSTLHAQQHIQKLLSIYSSPDDYKLPDGPPFELQEPFFFELIESLIPVLAVMDIGSPLFNICKHKIDGLMSSFAGITDKLTNFDRNILIVLAFNTLFDWPSNFYTFLDHYRQRGNDSYFPGLSLEYRPLGNMFAKLRGQEFEFLKKTFQKYLFTCFTGATLRRNNRHFSREEFYRNRLYMGPEEASQVLGVSFSVIVAMIKTKKICSIPGKLGLKTISLIERENIEGLKRKWADCLNIRQVGEKLSVSDKVVLEIIKSGFLKADRVTPRFLLVKKRDFDSFSKKFLSGESIDQFNDKETWLKLREAAKHFNFTVVQTSRILYFIDKDMLKPFLNLSQKGLKMLEFKKSDIHKCKALLGLGNSLLSKYEAINIDKIRTYLIPFRKGAKEVYMAPERVATLLEVSSRTIEALIGLDFLKVVKKSNCSGKVISRISVESFAAFRNEYFQINEGARLLGVGKEKISQWIHSKKLKKVIILGSDKRCRYLVSKIELTYLKNNLLSIEDAAKYLGVTIPFLESLIYAEILSATKLSRKRTLIHRDELEEVKKAKDKELTLSELAYRLNISRREIIKLIDAKDIVSVSYQGNDDGVGNTLTQLDADILCRIVNQSEVARMLNVTSGAVTKWTNAGLLQPTVGPNIDGLKHYGFRRIDAMLFSHKRELILNQGRKKLAMSRFPAMSDVL